MKFLKILALSSAVTICSTAAFAQLKVDVTDSWARSTVIFQRSSGAFMKLTANEDAKLISAKTPIAGVVEIHEMKTENGVMRMNAVLALELPKGKAVELKPGGYHIMLMDLKSGLSVGEIIDVTLTIEDSQKKQSEIMVKVPVQSLTSRKAAEKPENK
jgi:periplasmic copper chaperone A